MLKTYTLAESHTPPVFSLHPISTRVRILGLSSASTTPVFSMSGSVRVRNIGPLTHFYVLLLFKNPDF